MGMTKRDYIELIGLGVNIYCPERLLVGLGNDDEIPFDQMTDDEKARECTFNALEKAAADLHIKRITGRGPERRHA